MLGIYLKRAKLNMTTIPFNEIQEKTRVIKAGEITIQLPEPPKQYYRHGWQSWSLAAWTDPSPLPVQMPAIFHPLQVDAEHVRKKYQNGSWLGAVEFSDGNILLLGALATDANVFLAQDQLAGQSEADAIEWFIAYGQENIVFAEYAEQLRIRLAPHSTTKNVAAPRVWCSWYSL